MAGYSGTPLARKLGLREGMRVILLNAPKHYEALIAPAPPCATYSTRLSAGADMVHLFATERRRLSEALAASVAKLSQGGMIWVSWPKRASQVPTVITEDTIREVAFPLGLVDIKVCAVDEVWSGLKLVIRKALRSKPR